MPDAPARPDDLLDAKFTFSSLTRRTLSLSAGPFRVPWLVGVMVSASLAMLMLASIAWLLVRGVGVWGVNIPTAWGFAITNFVWWIGIGHAGTLISAILLLMRQNWRNSINRFAEAMTLFAIAMAGIFPLFHLGRAQRFYYLLPYPNQMELWPQWRSPLVWDVVAVLTYATVSLVFWYLGLMPDLATVRDTARSRAARRIAGVLSLGWRGSAQQWHRYHTTYFLLAAIATPLVVSVHSIVSLDFSVAIVPGWHSTIFPPYFVAGAIFSGMAMVLTICVPLRRAFALYDLITLRHLDVMAKVTLTSALIVDYGYLMEVFTEWYSSDLFELTRLADRFVGPDAPIFITVLVCNLLAPQALWWPRVRRSAAALFLLAFVFNIGMWLERYDIIVSSLSHASHLSSSWGPFNGTFWDWSLLAGSLGTFALLFLLFVRFTPIMPIHELRTLLRGARTHHAPEPREPAPPPITQPEGEGPILLARFATPGALLEAVAACRDERIDGLNAFTPMRVEGLAEAIGIRETRLPWVFAAGAVLGAGGAYFMQWYASVVSYPWNIGGRPLHSWPSFIPLTFEGGVLCASLAGFAAFIIANRFPMPYDARAQISSFGRAGIDRFFLSIPAGGGERAARTRLLGALGAERVDSVGAS